MYLFWKAEVEKRGLLQFPVIFTLALVFEEAEEEEEVLLVALDDAFDVLLVVELTETVAFTVAFAVVLVVFAAAVVFAEAVAFEDEVVLVVLV